MKAVLAQLALGLVNTWYAATIAWRLGSSRPTGSGGGPNSRDVGLGQVQARAAEAVPGVVDTALLSPQRASSLRSRPR